MRNAAVLSLLIGAGSSYVNVHGFQSTRHHRESSTNVAINNRNQKSKLSMSIMDDVTENLGRILSPLQKSPLSLDLPPALIADMDKLFTTGLTVEQKFAHVAIMYGNLPQSMQIAVAAIPIVTTVYGILYNLSHPEYGYRRGYEPYRRGSYDPLVAKAYYSRHPLLVAKRALEVSEHSYFWNGRILILYSDIYLAQSFYS